MLTSRGLRALARELERAERLANPQSRADLRNALAMQLGFAAGWIDALRAFEPMPRAARRELHAAGEAVARASRILTHRQRDDEGEFDE